MAAAWRSKHNARTRAAEDLSDFEDMENQLFGPEYRQRVVIAQEQPDLAVTELGRFCPASRPCPALTYDAINRHGTRYRAGGAVERVPKCLSL